MNLLRKYKLKELGIEIDEDSIKIIDFIEELFRDIEVKTISTNKALYYKDNKCLFEYVGITLYVDSKEIWYKLERNYKVDSSEIIYIMIEFFWKYYNKKIKLVYNSDLNSFF